MWYILPITWCWSSSNTKDSPSCFPQGWDLTLPDGCGENGVMGEMLGAAAGTDILETDLVFSVRQFGICRHRYLSSVSCFGCPPFKVAVENCRGFRGELRRTSAVQNLRFCQRPSKVITLKRQDHSDLAPLWQREKRQLFIWAGWRYDRTQWAEAS